MISKHDMIHEDRIIDYNEMCDKARIDHEESKDKGMIEDIKLFILNDISLSELEEKVRLKYRQDEDNQVKVYMEQLIELKDEIQTHTNDEIEDRFDECNLIFKPDVSRAY